MSDVAKRIADLSPEKRALLTLRLKQKNVETARQAAIPRRDDPATFPLSYAQQRLWFLDQLEPDSPFYNIAVALRLDGPLDRDALGRSLTEIVRRHEVLRASFTTERGQPVQRIAPPADLPLPLVDLSDLPAEAREAEALRLATAEARRPFDLGSGPLLRASLIRLAAADHVMLLTLHHIVADAWSTAVMTREIALLYPAFSAGKPAPLTDPPIQYADFAAWQRAWLEGAGDGAETPLQTQLAYWQAKLGSAQPVLQLPADRPRPAVQTYNGAHHSFRLPRSLADRLRAVGQAESATLFMTLLAAFNALLYRYTNQADICVGTPIATRSRAELEGLVGFFINTLVVRSDLTGKPSFRELLRRVRTTALEAYAHQDLPFEMLLDELHITRDLSYTPLFQVMFSFQELNLDQLAMGDLKLRLLETETGAAKCDLLLLMTEDSEGLGATLEYNTDLFDAATMARMEGHFRVLLEGIAANPDMAITRLPLLTSAERQQLLVEWNATATDYPRTATIHGLFAVQAAQTPDAVALVFGDRQLTYAELNARANQLAHHLQALGVGPGMPVVVAMERSLELIIGLLGILKAGGAYVPIDPHYPAERIQFMLEDVRPLVVLHDGAAEAPALAASRRVNLADWSAIAPLPATDPADQATAESLAYIIYTSGSTGRPKGVCVPHRGVVRLVKNTNYFNATPDEVLLQMAPISFDASTLEVWASLLNGAKLAILPPQPPTLAQLSQALRDYGVTTLWITTGLFHLMVEEQLAGLRQVRRVFTGGDVMSVAHARTMVAEGGDCLMVNFYGPTENTTFSTFHPVTGLDKIGPTVSIGRPIANTTVYILDPEMQPTPIGVPGELYVGGDGLAHGYHNRPDLTAEKFVPNPFGSVESDSGQRSMLYRTGDLARYLPDGSIEFIGRIDHQVKIRGFRIELGEIETVLGRCPAVRETVVVAREDTPGNKRLVAYVVPNAEAGSEAGALSAQLREHLKSRLPDYMLPAVFVPLDALPLDPNGKVNRKALPAPDQSRPELERSYVAPRTPVEAFLTAMWQDVLKLDQIGIHDNFFELGGDSLQAAVLTNRIQEELGVAAHVRALFMAPNVADLAAYLNEYYPDVAAKIGGAAPVESLPPVLAQELAGDDLSARIDAARVAQIRRLITPLPPRAAAPETRNPPAVFILSPPRSGSTLLRTMLAGHPRLFAPPELDLLSFNTLRERKAAFSGKHSFWLEGPIRAIMELQGCDAAMATRMMEAFETQDLTTQQFYRRMQEWLGDRLLVDKTPVYALDPAILRRAEADFADVRYIHLMRHPYASVYSFVEARLDQVFFRHAHPFTKRELAELVWIISHEHILEFLQTIPAARQHYLSFEALVGQPQATMERLCDFLGLAFDPAMLQPYAGRRMTDGVRPDAQMVGDFKFYLRNDIDPQAASRWERFHSDDFLSNISWRLAERLGYGRRTSGVAPLRRQPRDRELPLSFAQQRLWFLDQLEPGSALYNVPAALRLSGALDVAAMERSLNEIVRRHEVLRTTFATVDGRPVQVIAPELQVRIPVVDLRSLPAADREAEARRLVAADAQAPFDLATGPLFRATLLRVGDQEHVITMTLHHIVADGWSTSTLIGEIAALYAAFTTGGSASLPDLPIQYADYAAWQRDWLQSEMVQTQLAYWRNRLQGSPARLELPTDRPRPAVPTNRGARLPFVLSGELLERLKTLSKQTGVTLFMTLTAAFQALLARYSNQDDICVGTPVANRNRAEIEPLIGFFVNMLVLRTDLSGSPTFRELLARVQQVATEAYAHQDLPFEMLVDELQPERSLSHAPLFQALIALQKAQLQLLELPGLTLTPLNADSQAAKYDLTLSLTERTDGIRGALEYNTDLFDAATIHRMIGHFQHLLEVAVANPDMPVARLPLLSADEQRRQIVEWNATAAPYPTDLGVHQLFAEQVARTPEAVAVAFEGQRLTYAELNARANQLAHALQAQGVGPETVVAVCVERSVAMVVAVLGVLKAGGAYLPIDPTYPAERIAWMLADARPRVVLHDALGAEPTRSAPQRINLADWSAVAAQPETNPPDAAGPDNLAYVIYTSGSTGRPKGVLLAHRGMRNLVAEQIRAFAIGPESRVLQFASLSFDASVSEIFTALLAGATLVLARRETLLSLPDLVALFRGEAISVVTLPPSLLALLPAEELPGLRTVVSAGESCPWAIAARWGQGRRFLNAYGPTETTVGPTWYLYDGSDSSSGAATTPIGRPIANVQVYVLDRHMQPAPVGVPGELYIGGVGVARGYLNRPDLTAEKFVPNPFGGVESDSGQRSTLYKTGDLARYLPDGAIECLGRVDQQVKIRGFRIEVGEIEAALRRHPAVREAAVIAREDTPGSKRLAAYIVPAADAAPGALAAQLREFLAAQLPDYMLPAAFVSLDALPLTPNGKVDRAALPAPDQVAGGRPDLASAYSPPTTPAEETLAAIWAQVLGVAQVGVRDNFFELGGDSILSIQVIARANQAGLRLTAKQLFQFPTIAELAAVAGTARAITAEQGVVAGPLPLTPIQRWFFAQELAEPHHWNQALLLETHQPLERAPLERAIAALLAHHDALRLRFSPVSGAAAGAREWQAVNAGLEELAPVAWVDLAGLPPGEQRARLETTAAQTQASLNLECGPLLRVVYFDLGAGQPGRLLLVIHHLAVDGVAWRVLLEDFQLAYRQFTAGAAVQLPPKTTSFRQWAERLLAYAQSAEALAERDYWLSLAARPIAPLPIDHPAGANTEATAQQVVVTLDAETTRALLQEVPATYATTINDVLLTALAQALLPWTGGRALLLDLEGHGREELFPDIDISRTVGWFTTSYPLRLDLDGAYGPGEALRAVKEQLRRVPNRGIGYGLLRYLNADSAVRAAMAALPQPEISFNYLGQFDQVLAEAATFRPAAESSGPSQAASGRRTHRLALNGSVAGGQLQMAWSYSAAQYERATVARLADAFIAALHTLISHCQSPDAGGYTPSDFPDVALSSDELEALMAELGEH